MARSRCLPQGLLKLVTSWPRGLQSQPACPAPFRPCRRCCTAQSVTFFSQLSTLYSLQSLHSLFNCPHCWLSNICTCAYADASVGVALIRPQFTRDSPTIHPRFTNNLPTIVALTIVVVVWAHSRPLFACLPCSLMHNQCLARELSFN